MWAAAEDVAGAGDASAAPPVTAPTPALVSAARSAMPGKLERDLCSWSVPREGERNMLELG